MGARIRKVAKRVGKGIGITALASLPVLSGVGIYNKAGRLTIADEKYFKEIQTVHGRADISNHPLHSAILDEVVRRNSSAKATEIYFVNPKTFKIEKVDFGRYDFDRLRTMSRLFNENQMDRLNNVIAQRMNAIAGEATRNPKIMDLIVKRVGSLDVAKYLLSLSAKERAQVFSKIEQKEIHSIIESLPEEKAAQVKKSIDKNRNTDAAASALIPAIVTALIMYIIKRK